MVNAGQRGQSPYGQSATGGDPSRLEKAGRSRICLSDNGKILKADCGFGLDHSKKANALLLRCSDAEVGQDRASGFDRPSTGLVILWYNTQE